VNCERPKWSPSSASGWARCLRWRCQGCAEWLGKVETRALLNEVDDRPLSFLTVTTRDPDMALLDFQRCFEALLLRLKRRYGPVDYYGCIEGTSGRLARDGRRRMHGHYIVKGVPHVSLAHDGFVPVRAGKSEAERLVRDTWERTTLRRCGEAGRAYRVTFEAVGSRSGVSVYVAGYLSKYAQVMDGDWRGRRIRCSQRFFAAGRVAARERAKIELIVEAQAWREGYRSDDPAIPLMAEVEVLKRLGVLDTRKRLRAELAELAASVILDTSNEPRRFAQLSLLKAGEVVTPDRDNE